MIFDVRNKPMSLVWDDYIIKYSGNIEYKIAFLV